MSMEVLHLHSELLLAYVDGHLNAPDQEKVERIIEQDPTAQTFVEQLEKTQLPFKESFERLLDERPEIIASKSKKYIWQWSTAITASLFLGIFLGKFLLSSSIDTKQNWLMQVASYQALYVRDTIQSTELSGSEIAKLKQRLENKLKSPLVIPNLMMQKLQFKRGQVLTVNGSPLIQLAYLPESGNPVALCITHNNQADALPKIGSAYGMPLVHWSHNNMSYVIIGGIDRDQLKAAAYSAISQLSVVSGS